MSTETGLSGEGEREEETREARERGDRDHSNVRII